MINESVQHPNAKIRLLHNEANYPNELVFQRQLYNQTVSEAHYHFQDFG
jgi:hypothetical protein